MDNKLRIIPEVEDVSFQSFYDQESKDLNNFSYWYPKVEKLFKTPKTVHFKLDPEISQAILEFYEIKQNPDNKAKLEKWSEEIEKIVKDNFQNFSPYFFMKNARYSDKFNFSNSCMCGRNKNDILRQFTKLNYASMCCDALGFTEIVLREFLDVNPHKVFTIYNGMPLRPEYRVFYDFDNKNVICVCDYWNASYVYPNLYEASDKLVFSKTRPRRERLWKSYLPKVIQEASKLSEVEGLKGIWSVDFLAHTKKTSGLKLGEEKSGIYLIDMALGCQSAYWNEAYSKLVEEKDPRFTNSSSEVK